MPLPERSNQRLSRYSLLDFSVRQFLTALALGALIWVPSLLLASPASVFPDRLSLLLIVMGNQFGCLLTHLASRHRRNSLRKCSSPQGALGTGLLGVLVAVLLGIAYDQFLRHL